MPKESSAENSGAAFPETHWTLVQRVQAGSVDDAATAMETICERYWYPIYAYLRRSGYQQEDAEDFTQGLFARLVSDEAILAVRREQGRLRSYLLGMLKRVIADHLRHGSAEKRGGGVANVSFDQMAAEERYACEPVDVQDPEWLFTRTWAHELFASVQGKLRAAFLETGKPEVFEAMLPFVTCDSEPPSQRELAAKLGMSTTAAGVMTFRLREKFRTLLREAIADTVLTPEEVPAEMEWLRSMLSSR
jgi:DNA-directed RNA polymerase specialized sigma24 family protein